MVKRIILIIAITGMFLTNFMLTETSAIWEEGCRTICNNPSDSSEVSTIPYYTINTVDFGYLGSINRDKSFGMAIVSDEPIRKANWISEGENVNGHIIVILANFIQNEDGDNLDYSRRSAYKIIVHDGPSISDPIIFSTQKPITENKDDLIEELEFPINFEKNGQSSRVFAVERIAETTIMSDKFNVPLKGKEWEDRKTTLFQVNFTNPNTAINTIDAHELLYTEVPSSNIDIYLGEIFIYWDMDEKALKISTNGIPNVPVDVFVNYSTDITITAYMDLTIDLPFAPKVHPFLPLGCKAHLSIDGGIPFNGGTKQTGGAYLDPVPLTEANLHKTFNLSCPINVNTGDSDKVLFLPSFYLSYYPINVWDFFPPWDSFEAKYITVKWKYV